MGIMEVANDLFGKGMDLAGSVAKQAGDFANTASLKAQILDKNLEFDRLMKELGAAVYDSVKDMPEMVEANEALFARIAGVVAARQELEDRLADVEAAADADRPIDVEPVEPVEPAEPEQQADAATATAAPEAPKAAVGYRSATIAGSGEGGE